jgi:hypothetical protein
MSALQLIDCSQIDANLTSLLRLVLVPDRGLISHSSTVALQIPIFELRKNLEAFTRPSTSSKHIHANLQVHSSFGLDAPPALAARVAFQIATLRSKVSRCPRESSSAEPKPISSNSNG